MKANHDKYHLLLSTQDKANIQIANVTIKIRFDKHVENLCERASRKLNSLAKLVNYKDLPKTHIFMNAFFTSEFYYRPVIWMFHSRSLNNKINKLHERCLKIIYNDKKSNFDEVLIQDNCLYTP